MGVAHVLSQSGKRVCLVDLDFRAPSIAFAYNLRKNAYWTNDYLNGDCSIEKVLIDVSDRYKHDGQLLIAPANYSTEAIRDITSKDRKWEMRSLGRLLRLRNSLLSDLNLDYCIYDACSGLSYSSINAVVCADSVIVVNVTDETQSEGTRLMLEDLYNLFQKKTGMLVNKVAIGDKSLTEMETIKTVEFERLYNLPVLGVIPCFCDLQEHGIDPLFVVKKPKHLYSKIISEIALRIDAFTSGDLVVRKDREIMKIYKERFIKKVTGVVL
jgi:MinD-like ATPase involved in chromosome partitioning or flagellar assembly